MVQGPAPKIDFDKLWEEQWEDKVESIAHNFAQRNEFHDPDYLASDLALLWLQKIVPGWPQYYAKSTKPNFDAWAQLIIRNYLTDQARKHRTGPYKMRQQSVPLESSPMGEGSGEDEGLTYEELIGRMDESHAKFEDADRWAKFIVKIDDPQMKAALGVIRNDMLIYHESTPAMWERVERAAGVSRTTVIRKLRENPALLDFLGLQ